MSLRQRFTEEMKTAMKGGDKARLAAIRMVQAALKDRDIEARGAGKEVSEEVSGIMLEDGSMVGGGGGGAEDLVGDCDLG